MPIYRAIPADDTEALAAVDAIDNSFVTTAVLEVTARADGFVLREAPVDPPLLKEYPDEDEERADGAEVVAAYEGAELCGAVTVAYQAWNRRLHIADLRVSPAHRGRGIGRGLLDRVLARGRELGARTAWLEVTSVNAPAVRAYRKMGFTFAGLDTTLYTGTASEGETALFMSRPLASG
ncbi:MULTISPECIES: GNAT family N-acetyltransferase [Streptomyces]|uniref:GNAT family N-acetyltransferase n=1 Tax=Streptomyces morookaense TaxID=1970 RepID=A0A7Y7AZG6_STRMO|nr:MULTISPECIES: GNAT family N-acetyltransferase [Streptomyces]MCC2276843.1 GNAT family N-acetyltransferase [Streptomyces sp. ET3-23]NVK76220.1 GNAT family N-acetyltransferase [Streptomyces morookaense]GHF38270.1 hypothetical protein GCM10010359_46220 [Streptomyces morookaense]